MDSPGQLPTNKISGQQFPKTGHMSLLHRQSSEDTKHDPSEQHDVKPAVRQGAKNEQKK